MTSVPAHARQPRMVAPQNDVVQIADGLLSVHLNGFRLRQFLAIVAQRARVRVILHGTADEPLTGEFQNVRLEEGLRRLLQGKNTVYYYALTTTHGASPGRELAAIRILDSSGLPAPKVAVFSPTSVPGPMSVPDETARAASPSLRSSDHALIDTLLSDPDPVLRRQAADTLRRSDHPGVIVPLSQSLLEDDSAAVRETAAKALGDSWSETAVQPLLEALVRDRNASVRERIVYALAQTADEGAVDQLARSLETDKRWSVREAAAVALGTIGGQVALAALQRAATADQDSWVRDAARLAMQDLGQ